MGRELDLTRFGVLRRTRAPGVDPVNSAVVIGRQNIGRRVMHGATVVPQQQVADLPFVPVLKLRLRAMREQRFE